VCTEDHHSWLPPLIEFNGNWATDFYDKHLERLYAQFRKDFVDSRPTFRGQLVAIGWKPEWKGKPYTFCHIISSGKPNETRTLDARRCERICWIRKLIELASAEDPRVRVWASTRDGLRWVISPDDFSFIVVLQNKTTYVLLITAVYVEEEHRRQKHRREYERYVVEQNNAGSAHENGPCTPSTHGG